MDALERARNEINETDRAMAELFEKRMRACAAIAEYKREHSMPVRDPARENEVVERGCLYIREEALREFYAQLLRACIDISCRYQEHIIDGAEK